MIQLLVKSIFNRGKNLIPGVVTDALSFTMDFVTEVEIDESVDNLSNTAKLTFPKKLKYTYNSGSIELSDVVLGNNPLFVRGTQVTLQAGYRSASDSIYLDSALLKERFYGYIGDVQPRAPITLELQDRMWQLKQTPVIGKTYIAAKLIDILNDIIPGIPKSVADITIGDLRIARSNVASVLEHLRSQFGITSYFVDATLHSGLRFITEDINSVQVWEFEREFNIIDDSDLTFQRSDDISVEMRAININDNNEKTEYVIGNGYEYAVDKTGTKIGVVGNSVGDVRTMYFYNSDDATLKILAKENYKKLIYTGFTGSFLTFLEPKVAPGDAIRLLYGKIPELNGTYLVSRVTTSYGIMGGRQEIHLDRKIGDGVRVVGDNVVDKNMVFDGSSGNNLKP